MTDASGESLSDARSYQGRADEGAVEAAHDREGAAAATKGGRRRIVLLVIIAVVAMTVAVSGFIWWRGARRFEATDDAYVDTKVTRLAPRASGQVLQVLVDDNQPVRAGQVLALIDDQTARNQLVQGRAAEASAVSQVAQAEAQVKVSAAQIAQAQANTRSPSAKLDFAQADYRRYVDVKAKAPAAVADQQLDTARQTLRDDAGQLDAARKQVQTSRAQLVQSRAALGAGRAQLDTARAQIAAARLQIDYGRIVAPVDGHIANKTVAVGDYAIAGQEVMSVVPNTLWVTANFKETQLKRVRPGQPVDVKIDAYPNIRFPAHVDSIQRGAGQSFSVLPSQNATGNFVKVVQRVPVKIVFDRTLDVHHPLGPGMSVEPRVRVE